MVNGGIDVDCVETFDAGLCKRVFNIHDNERSKRYALFYEFMLDSRPIGDPSFDGILFALILFAMERGQPLRLHGVITRTALYNALEFQSAWRSWRPERYKLVDVIPDKIIDPLGIRPTRKAISAFSGGVDATFTALRHRIDLPPEQRYPLTSVLMVHGFDVALKNTAYFDQLVARTEEMRSYLGVQLKVIRTNSKELGLLAWEDSFSSQLAACLHQFSSEFEFGLIGSSEPYDALVIPWGSTPITDHLLSGDGFSIVHDGAGFSRTDKVAVVGKYPTATRGLKVCWEGTLQFENCGTCEKCVRTQLNFIAAGYRSPECFPKPLELKQISKLSPSNEPQLAELRSIVKYANAHGLGNVQPIQVLSNRIKRYHPDRTFRAIAKRCIRSMAMEKYALRLRHFLIR